MKSTIVRKVFSSFVFFSVMSMSALVTGCFIDRATHGDKTEPTLTEPVVSPEKVSTVESGDGAPQMAPFKPYWKN